MVRTFNIIRLWSTMRNICCKSESNGTGELCYQSVRLSCLIFNCPMVKLAFFIEHRPDENPRLRYLIDFIFVIQATRKRIYTQFTVTWTLEIVKVFTNLYRVHCASLSEICKTLLSTTVKDAYNALLKEDSSYVSFTSSKTKMS